jgi:hypothetical protein
MPVAIINHMPEGFTTETYDAVNKKAAVDTDPPEGLIFHSLAVSDSESIIIDLWETTDQYDAFRTGRLNPALEEEVGSEAFAAMPTPQRDYYETHSVVTP